MSEALEAAQQLAKALEEMVAVHTPQAGDIMVVGCSTSEVRGARIGKDGSMNIGAAFYPVLQAFAQAHDLHLAFQCCEHLNRALVVEKALARERHLVEVMAVPHARAGGSMATTAYYAMDEACLVESIQAGYGIDIGETMIGMHFRPVVVPMRIAQKKVGQARLASAFARPKLIGGERAHYEKEEKENCHEE